MTTAMPPDDHGREPGDRTDEPSDLDVDRIFAAMMAQTDFTDVFKVTDEDVAAERQIAAEAHELTAEQRAILAQRQRRRAERDRRKAMREFAYQAHAEAEQEREAEYAEDDEHFVPPEPPKMRRPRARTIVALALIVAAIYLVVGPNFLTIGPTAVLILAVALLLAGSLLLLSALRAPGAEDGWDDGARV